MLKLAILDDYMNMSLKLADWSRLKGRCEIVVFDRNLALPDEAAKELASFHILCHLRERMAMPRALFERLPNLRFVGVTGPNHRTLDLAAATERHIPVSNTSSGVGGFNGTAELALGLIIALSRKIAIFDRGMRRGAWQETLGANLSGRRLGIMGLGNIGKAVAQVATILGMEVVAWSPNLTEERVAGTGVKLVSKDELFSTSDIITLHMVLSPRSEGIVSRRELGLMKPTAYLVNTSRGPLVDEAALFETLQAGKIAGAGIDVYGEEPLPADHPIRTLENVLMTPHVGYVSEQGMANFYESTVENVVAFLDGKPIRQVNPDAGPGNPNG